MTEFCQSCNQTRVMRAIHWLEGTEYLCVECGARVKFVPDDPPKKNGKEFVKQNETE